jgi:hypothetical protein
MNGLEQNMIVPSISAIFVAIEAAAASSIYAVDFKVGIYLSHISCLTSLINALDAATLVSFSVLMPIA